ncbi:hypothetical protein [Haematobacter sp. UBA3484]|uniref:hypothetical protein n=1 Tax=Haematobacter sp. UBA3484 TaxID=1946582 RepID=UPI0025C0CC3A|nr:hypothetical protein [Haematobacter sp. UBA3484]
MAGPWEKYKSQPTAQQGPWTKYARTGDRSWRNDGQTGIVEQATSGFNEGLADLIGAPVDLMTSGINGVTGLINAGFGTEIPQIEDPALGGQSVRRMMAPTITEDAPQTATQRYGRSVAREVGLSVPVAGTLGRANSARQAIAAVAPTVASAVGSGVGAQAARDVFPNSPAAEVIGSLAGGLAPVGASYALRRNPNVAPSIAQLRDEASDLYQAGRARPGADAQSVATLKQTIEAELRANSRITPTGRMLAQGDVKNFVSALEDYSGQPMTPGEMQSMRSLLQDAAGSSDASDRRLGKALLTKFDDWAGQSVPEFRQANAIYGRAKRAEDVDFRVEKAERRAASTGTGGNTVNAARQNIRQILDNPKARRGYTAAEIDAMEAIVRGDSKTNILRLIGRLSPTSGALPLFGLGVSGSTLGPVGALPSAAGYFAKALAERRTMNQLNALSDLITSGAPAPSNALTAGERAAVIGAVARNALIGE